MTINKFNYEAYALDYLEGNLSPEMAAEMERFLKTHPAIESELSGMMEFVILEADESIVYEPKAVLLKPERVVWLNKKWIRPLMAAASIALLLMTYFLGYNAGINTGGEEVVVENGDFNGNNNSNNENVVAVKEIEASLEEETVVTITKKEVLTSKNDKANMVPQPIKRPSIVEEETPIMVNKERNYPTDKIPALTPNQLPLATNPITITEIESVMTTAMTTLAATNLLNAKVSSTKSDLNDLTQVLAGELPLDRAKLAQQLKPKRKFKDLLGKFPVNNLKEALIPSYYREEATGQ